MASKKEVHQFTGFNVGTISFSNILLPYLIDNRLLKYSSIYGGTGVENWTIKVSPQSLIALNEIVAYFD